MDRIRRLGVVGMAALALLAAPAAAQDAGLRIVVLEGENSVNVIEQGAAVPTLVEVRDRNDLPVAGALVRFLLGEGGTATLNAGLSQVALTTNALGQAAVAVNPIAVGAVELSVSATFGGETAMAAIVQANFATAAEAAAATRTVGAGAADAGGGGLGLGAMVGLAGAAVGGGLGLRAALAGDDAPPGGRGGPGDRPPVSNARAVLVEFYEATGGANWSNNANWNTDAPLSVWGGVAVDLADRVLGLSLYSNQLSGTIPSSLGGLTNLEWLRLGSNQLSGTIPSSLGGLTNLEQLYLDDNQLSGTIPSSLGGLTNLDELNLSYNQLSGTIPSSLGGLTNLEQLRLSNNQLSGSIPAALCRFAGDINPQQNGVILPCASGDDRAVLMEFYEAAGGANWANNANWNTDAPLNQWHGVTTDAAGDVVELRLPDNRLSGTIPSSLGSLANLDELVLAGNQLSGSIPAALCRFADSINPQQGGVILPCEGSGEERAVLAEFYEAAGGANWADNANWNTHAPLGQWHGVGTDAAGSVVELRLPNNRLSGTIPSSLSGLTNLRWLYLDGNQLSGTIPSSLGGLNLEILALGRNRLSGTIPSSLGGPPNLKWLSLSENQLSGSIPSSLGGLTNLELLHLAENQLSGTIPSSLGGLTNLESFWLSDNQLSGSIPAALCKFEDGINPQQGGVILPCAGSGEERAERAVLAEFYEAAGGGNWTDDTNWNTDAPLDQWHGVSTDAAGSVVELRLDNNRLSGTIPSSLGSLANLDELVLAGNQLSGSIPAALCRFADSINPQQGGVLLLCEGPGHERAVLAEFYEAAGGANWANNANWNTDAPLDQWHGVGTDTAGRVVELRLSINRLSGTIPSSLGGLPNLRWLYLAGNQLSGPIPSSLGGLNLVILNLANNQLSGPIPSSLGGPPNLKWLLLRGNQLSGPIPSSLGGLTNLELLDLAGNQLSGPIPPSLGGLPNLEWLLLRGNQLSGPIPSLLGSLTNLEVLDLSGNQLSGPVPSPLGGLPNLERLWLRGNQLSGPIPSSLGGLPNLEGLWLDDNQLLGPIPSSLGGLPNLEVLDLSGNQLSGTIPSSLGGLPNLERLWLRGNQLSGPIPSSLGGLPNLESLSLRYNQLSGSIPAALCRFEVSINPQQDGIDLPCASSGGGGDLEVRLVPGDRRLEVRWTAPSAGGPAIDGYDVRYRRAGGPGVPGGWTELAAETAGTDDRATITGLTNGAAYQVQVRAGAGGWSAAATGVPAAPAAPVTFGGARIEDQRWRQYEEAAPLVLPAATGGAGALTYALTPALPAGLAFDPAARTVSGTPSAPSPSATYTYAATDSAAPPSMASLTFTIEVEASAEEEALRRDALAAQGRALLSSVTGVIGERFRARRAGSPGSVGPGRGSAMGALGNALAALPGMQGQGGLAASAGFGPGAGPGGHLGGLSAPGAGMGPGDALEGLRQGPFGVGVGGWDGLVWGRSFQAPLGGGAAGGGASRYTVWGAGDRQSFSGSPEAGRYRGDLRSLYVGADGRLGADWLAGAAVGRSWGAADYAAASAGGAAGRLTTRMTSVYPYLRGRVSRGLELWAVGGYGRGEAADARGAEPFGEPGALTMTMTAAGLRQDVAEGSGAALSVVGGAGSLSLSSADGGPTVAGLAARVHRGRLALEASRASGAVSPFVQFGGRWDGGDGQTGAGLELVGGLRASTARLALEARGRWLSAHSAAGYEEYGAMARLAFRARPDGTGLRAALAPRWGAAGELSLGGDGLLGGAGADGLHPGASWTPAARALSVDGEVGYGWRPRRLRGVLSPTASWRRTGFGGDVTRAGLSWLSSEDSRRDVRMQLTLGRERWREQRAGYQLAVALASVF